MSDSDLLHHYRVLKQFLDISDDSNTRAKSNSSRAARAREKLLRLSGAQFRELSTDVYDELRRRIDESRSEPDFLLPKLTFHPKRNQARQKLSSLPQSRFKDLVLDISFEIERRNLHSPAPTPTAPDLPVYARLSQDLAPADTPQPRKLSSMASSDRGMPRNAARQDVRRSTHSTSMADLLHATSTANSTALQDEIATPDLRKPVAEQAIGIQPTTVVPTKADMAWSSEEEEETDQISQDDRNSISEEPRQLMLSNAFANHHAPSAPIEESPKTVLAPERLEADDRYAELKSAYDSLMQEHESLIAAHSDAETRLATLTDLHANVEAQLSDLNETHNSAQRDLRDLSEKHSRVLSQHGALEALIESISHEVGPLSPQQATLTSLEQVLLLKNELEDLKSSNASLRLENQNLKLSSPKSKNTITREAQPQNAHSVIGEPDSFEINTELRRLYEKLEDAPKIAEQTLFSRKEAKLKSEISQWQDKYASLKTGELQNMSRNPAMSMNLTKFRSPDGLLSYETAVKFFASVDLFYAALDISNPDADLFFERISSVAMSANAIASQGTQKGFSDNGHADAIRESASHALTATRYFVIYPTLMPKVIVERAVSELTFAVCDFISSLKFSYPSDVPSPSPNFRSKSHKSEEVAHEVMEVKPLKITQKKASGSSCSDLEKQSSGVVTPHNQITDSSPTPIHTLLTPIEHGATSQSLPTQKQGDIQNSVQTPDVERKLSLSAKLSLKKLFGSKSKDEPNATEHDKNIDIEAIESGNKHFEAEAEFLKSSFKQMENEIVSTESTTKAPTKLASPSILDKVRKFETDVSKQKVASLVPNEKSQNVGTKHTLSVESNKSHRIPEAVSSQLSGDSAQIGNKSIFQSLRERFTHDNAVPAFEANEVESYNESNDRKTRSSKAGSSFDEMEAQSRSKPNAEFIPKSEANLSKNHDIQSRISDKPKILSVSSNEVLDGKKTDSNQSIPTNEHPIETFENITNKNSVVTESFAESGLKEIEHKSLSSAGNRIVSSTSDRLFQSKDGKLIESYDQALSPKIYESLIKSDKSTLFTNDRLLGVPDDKSHASTSLEQGEEHRKKPDFSENADDFSRNRVAPANEGNKMYSTTFRKQNSFSGNESTTETAMDEYSVIDRARTGTTSDQEQGSLRVTPASQLSVGLPAVENTRFESVSANGKAPEELENCESSELQTDGLKPDILSKPSGETTTNTFRSVAQKSSALKPPIGLNIKSPSFKVRKVNYEDAVEEQGAPEEFEDADDDSFDEEEDEIRQRQDYRKSMAAATFNFDLFDIDDPDNTVTQVLLYLEHQTVQVISTIQDLLSAIKKPDATRGELRENSGAISEVIKQMTEATNTSMNQTRNYLLREHGSWVVKSLEDCNHRMNALCKPNTEKQDVEFADRHFKQRLAGISFDIAKCTKELVKTVEEASLKEDIAHLDARLNHPDDLT